MLFAPFLQGASSCDWAGVLMIHGHWRCWFTDSRLCVCSAILPDWMPFFFPACHYHMLTIPKIQFTFYSVYGPWLYWPSQIPLLCKVSYTVSWVLNMVACIWVYVVNVYPLVDTNCNFVKWHLLILIVPNNLRPICEFLCTHKTCLETWISSILLPINKNKWLKSHRRCQSIIFVSCLGLLILKYFP